MKLPIIVLTLAATLQMASAQEQLSREEALKYAFAVSVDLQQLQGTPIPSDVDVKNPIAVRDGDYGGLFLPESKLTPEAIAKAGDKIVTIGQLWLHKLAPARNGQAISSDKLRLAKVYNDGAELQVPQCTLGVRRTPAGNLELVLLGKTTDPLLTAPIRSVESRSQQAFVLDAERDSDGGQATITFFGKFKAQLSFTELES